MVGWMLPLTFGTCIHWGRKPSYCFGNSHFFQCLLAYEIPIAFMRHRYHFLSHFIEKELRLREVHYWLQATYPERGAARIGTGCFNDSSVLPTTHTPVTRGQRGRSLGRGGAGEPAFTHRSVFILQAGAGDGAAIQEDLALGRGHLPTPLELVVQQRVLPKDEPSGLPVVDNVTLRTDSRALQ